MQRLTGHLYSNVERLIQFVINFSDLNACTYTGECCSCYFTYP